MLWSIRVGRKGTAEFTQVSLGNRADPLNEAGLVEETERNSLRIKFHEAISHPLVVKICDDHFKFDPCGCHTRSHLRAEKSEPHFLLVHQSLEKQVRIDQR